MKVSQAMSERVLSCRSGDSMEQAAQIMWNHDCGCVPVLDDKHTIQGVITDRDIAMAAYTGGTGLGALSVDKAMSKSVVCCRAEDDLEQALKVMAESQVHRLPVIDKQKTVIGMLSLTDAVQTVGRQRGEARRKWADSMLDTLLQVTRPRGSLKAPVRSSKTKSSALTA